MDIIKFKWFRSFSSSGSGAGGGQGGHGPPNPINDYLFAPLAINKIFPPFILPHFVQHIIFPHLFCLTSLSILFLEYFANYHSSKIFQVSFTWHIISQLIQIESRSFTCWSWFHIFLGVLGVHLSLSCS